MPKYKVTVNFTKSVEITVFAKDEDRAMEKAQEIVEGWNDASSVEAVEAEEAD